MTASWYALSTKLDLVLKDCPQMQRPNGREVWDFEPEQCLIWIDRLTQSHVLEVPSAPLALGESLRTICGSKVSTTRFFLVDAADYGDPSCPNCFAETLRRMDYRPSVWDTPMPRKRFTRLGAALCMLGAVVLTSAAYEAADVLAPVEIAISNQVSPTVIPAEVPDADDDADSVDL